METSDASQQFLVVAGFTDHCRNCKPRSQSEDRGSRRPREQAKAFFLSLLPWQRGTRLKSGRSATTINPAVTLDTKQTHILPSYQCANNAELKDAAIPPLIC